ncbi:NAD(P)-dependent oxidoreductase [Phormidium sp. LEGE 05292]|uniref:NAD(P)-dependent oxidoreductase n=1 Tax=[Phormidium] sp. LEGE 05292 TaxID=767427 RepID=UPI001882E335|nr:NAD(P)-dependent oxidoreductase [Phormidium sp. LEGE 05292]MBE9229445.1 NAD(P)-dependent oxidoreductase [Phormidium sp. LEGE 05292]
MKVGFLGTGLMGKPLVQRLLTAKIPVIAYNRTASKLDELKTAGVEVVDSPESAIANSDCIILMLTNASAIEQVLLSDRAKIQLKGRTIIQMGTISPQESQEIEKQVIAAGGEYLEAPVLGSIPEAETGKLIVMVGGTSEQFVKWSNLLKNFGSEPRLIGAVGTAAAVKLALNQLIASLTTAFALSLSLVEKQGVEVETFMEILRQSALYAPTFDKKLKRMLERDFTKPNFPTKHLLKDTNLFLNQAQSNNLNTNSLEGVRQILEIAQQMGLADADYSALFNAVNP